VDHAAPPTGHVNIFPNPAGSSASVSIELPAGIDSGELVIYDPKGQEVKRIAVDRSSGSVTLNTSVVPAGTYFHQVLTAQGVVRGPKLIVIH
jgi:hypothetical protein